MVKAPPAVALAKCARECINRQLARVIELVPPDISDNAGTIPSD